MALSAEGNMLGRRSLLVTVTFLLNALAYQNAIARDLTLEDRIIAQEAIERVYWDHRTWPPENRTPKPPLEGVLSREQIRARVVDYLRKSNALAAIWTRPITAEQLQSEMRRMADESQAPDVLLELFAALGDDPFLIAETLARQTLADRLIREAYAGDDRFGVGIRTPAALVEGLEQTADSDSRQRSFDAWWVDVGASIGEDLMPVSESIQAVEIPSAPACVEDSWRAIPAGPAPFVGHAAVWTGSEMIIWGQYSTGYPASGGRYNPVTNSWTVTSDVDRPAIRGGFGVVWTGKEMIVWGGATVGYPSYLLNDGGRYDPTANSWRRTSASGAPVPRGGPSAVWTGSEMIIWGGDTGYGTINSGGRYDPASDTWVSTSEVNVPGTRGAHTAVWTGTEMVVWGGDTSGDGHSYAAVNTGGRYNPSTDTWRPTSLANAPGRRSRHTAVWTGSEMIVWGGASGRYFSTGSRYDPSGDTWTETSLYGVPDGRESHSAVWTGHEMIIWGGHQGGQPFNGDGGRYNPSFNTWVGMSPVGAPIPEAASTAVWTGSEMLVWRGYAGTTNGYSGRYCASTCAGATTFYKDADGDSYGNRFARVDFCAPAVGYVDNNADCDDTNAGIHPGAVELCNRVDDNCNDRLDDGLGTTTCGTGACQVTVDNCVGGIPQTCTPGSLTAEICNGVDDNCNDWIDEGLGTTMCGTGACQVTVDNCAGGIPQTCTPGSPAAEICNGVDDNCNDQIDEGLGTTMCGTGACQVTVDSCVGGIPQTCTPGSPAAEVCNGIDDNCNGLTDDGLGPDTVEVRPDPAILWPAKHKMVDVHVGITISGTCPTACANPPTVVLTSVSSSEPDDANGAGDGITADDIQDATVGSADFDIKLRAERNQNGNGRLYQISYTATDCFGITASAHARVLVPLDPPRKQPAAERRRGR